MLVKLSGAYIGIFLGINFSSLGWSNADNLDDVMAAGLDRYNVRGASIAFFDRNTLAEPILRSYGKISSSDGAENVTPDTVFMIASVSKLFAGTAVLKLVSQGTIALDDNICDSLPAGYNDDSACVNPLWPNTPVTWRMLVTHTSSLRRSIPPLVNGQDAHYGPAGGYFGYAVGNPTCPLTDVTGFYRDIMIDKATETSVGSDINVDWFQVATADGGTWEDFEPGTQTLYSNFAVGYIAALVEHVSGQSFPDYCKANIFDPLGMENTAWFRNGLPDGVLETLPVEYYGPLISTGGTFADMYDHIDHYCFIDYASGSLRTTASDMALFLDSMLDYGAPSLWPSEIGETALRCAEGTTNAGQCEFGVSWILLKKDNAEFWLDPALDLDWTDAAGHDGAEVGSQTQVIIFPAAGVYAIVFTNTDGNDSYAAQELMRYLLQNKYGSDFLTSDSAFNSCLSPEATALVEGKGKTAIKDIVIGEKVMTASGKYKPVYTISHSHHNKPTTFVRVTTDRDDEKPLELTPLHMLFLEGTSNPVPAKDVKIGDFLLTLNGCQEVTRVGVVTRNGFYNPVTVDGTILVDGIIVSTYTSLNGGSYLKVAERELISFQSLFDITVSPYRAFCMSASLHFCNQLGGKQNDRPSVVHFMMKLYEFWSQQNVTQQFILVFAYLFVFGFAYIMFSPIGIFFVVCSTGMICLYFINEKLRNGKEHDDSTKHIN